MKKLLRIIFSRAFLIVAFLGIELLVVFSLFKVFGDHLYWILGGTHLISFFMILYLVNSRHSSSVKLVWVVMVLILPIFSTLLYWFIATDFLSFFARKKFLRLKQEFKIKSKAYPEELKEDREFFNFCHLQDTQCYMHTSSKYFRSGEEIYRAMLQKLGEAKEFIFLEYFIIAQGEMWGGILEILKQKAKDGVEVRVMYDGMCAITMLPYDYPKELEKYGIRVKVFAQITPFISMYHNSRDHRKIMIIDGRYGFSGGVNLADEYINKIEKYGHWKDGGVLLEGQAVEALCVMFLMMWNAREKFPENIHKYLKNHLVQEGDGYVIPYGGNPYDRDLRAEKIYIDMINNAKYYLYIATPYFVVDEHIVFALQMASQRGVDVRIILPSIPDKELVLALAYTYYPQLLEFGIKIYEYTPGFIHSKMFVSDDVKAIVGTINLDYRSLYHHFECGVYFYRAKIVQEIRDDFFELFRVSRLVDETWKEKRLRRIKGKLLKLFAPLI